MSFLSRVSPATPCPHALLNHPDLGVRPPGQPLPAALTRAGGILADVFVRWLRQRDDAGHAAEKALLTQVLRSLPDEAVRREAQRQAAVAAGGQGWDHWVWAVPVATVAGLLGIHMNSLDEQGVLVRRLRAIAAGLAENASSSEVQAGNRATQALLMALRDAEATAPDAPLQSSWLHATAGHQWADALTGQAHRLAMLWQSHEAGTALLGHGLLHLVRTGTAPGREQLRDIASEGGAVRLTRRFAQRATAVSGCPVAPGAPFTVTLTERSLIFGEGAHRCPGDRTALTTAAAALQWAAVQGVRPLPSGHHRVALPNMALVMFGSGASPTPHEGDLA